MALPSSNIRERQSSTLCIFYGFNCVWAKVILILYVALVSRIFCLCVFILCPSRSPGYCRRTSGLAEQTSPISASTSVFFSDHFQKWQERLMFLRSPTGSTMEYPVTGSDDGLTWRRSRRQAVIWINDGLVYWRMYAPFGHNELIN